MHPHVLRCLCCVFLSLHCLVPLLPVRAGVNACCLACIVLTSFANLSRALLWEALHLFRSALFSAVCFSVAQTCYGMCIHMRSADLWLRRNTVCGCSTGWTRVIVEKPFGRDSASSAELGRGLAKHLKEEQVGGRVLLLLFHLSISFSCLCSWCVEVGARPLLLLLLLPTFLCLCCSSPRLLCQPCALFLAALHTPWVCRIDDHCPEPLQEPCQLLKVTH